MAQFLPPRTYRLEWSAHALQRLGERLPGYEPFQAVEIEHPQRINGKGVYDVITEVDGVEIGLVCARVPVEPPGILADDYALTVVTVTITGGTDQIKDLF